MEWFRLRAARSRWTEEVDILKEEFRRMGRGSLAMSDAWTKLSTVHEGRGRPGAAAYAAKKANMYALFVEDVVKKSKRAGVDWVSDEEQRILDLLRSFESRSQ